MNNQYVEVVIAMLGFLVGLCGVFVQTRQDGKKGFRAVTPGGWILAVLLTATLAAGLYSLRQTEKRNTEKLAEEIQARKDAEQAREEERRAKEAIQTELREAKRIQNEILTSTQASVEELIQRSGVPQDNFKITIKTGKSGTDAFVSVRLHGKRETSQWRTLNNDYNDFEEGQTDHFLMSSMPLGELVSVEIKRSKGKENDAGWKVAEFEVFDLKRLESYRIELDAKGLLFHRDPEKGGLRRTEKLVKNANGSVRSASAQP